MTVETVPTRIAIAKFQRGAIAAYGDTPHIQTNRKYVNKRPAKPIKNKEFLYVL